jgi:hypothetical protein
LIGPTKENLWIFEVLGDFVRSWRISLYFPSIPSGTVSFWRKEVKHSKDFAAKFLIPFKISRNGLIGFKKGENY